MVFSDVDKLKLTFTPDVETAEQFVIFMLDKSVSTIPTATNIVYINQEASEGKIDFTIYPSELENGEYGIYVSSSDEKYAYQELGSLKVTDDWVKALFTLGNVDLSEDELVTLPDAMMVLDHIVENITLEGNQVDAADVNLDGAIALGDAMMILDYIVENIVSF